MQKHWDVLRSDNAGDQWNEVSGNLPTDFGFRLMSISTTGNNLRRPDHERLAAIIRRKENCACIVARPAAANGTAHERLPQKDCYVNVLARAMAVDSLDKCGVYFGTTGGQVYCSANAAFVERYWSAICGGLFRRGETSNDPVVLPFHLRNLAA